MEINTIDPRTHDWETERPRYRVYFWKAVEPQGESGRVGYESNEYEITEAEDIREVLRWAGDTAGPDRTFTVYVVVDHDGTGLVHVAGTDPTRGETVAVHGDRSRES